MATTPRSVSHRGAGVAHPGDQGQAAPFLERLERERAARRVSPSILARVYAVQARTRMPFAPSTTPRRSATASSCT